MVRFAGPALVEFRARGWMNNSRARGGEARRAEAKSLGYIGKREVA